MRFSLPIFAVSLLAVSSTSASANQLYQGTFGDGNNTLFQILDSKYLIYCRDGAPSNPEWKCRRRIYDKTDAGFVIQYNRRVERKDSVVLEINKSESGYELIHKRPRSKADTWARASTKPVGHKLTKANYEGSWGPRKDASFRYSKKRLTLCFNKKCKRQRAKSFGATLRHRYRNGNILYLVPISESAAVGTYVQSDGQYSALFKAKQ